MAHDTKDFVLCTVQGWFSGFKRRTPNYAVGGREYLALLIANAEHYFNLIDKALPKHDDQYLDSSFENMRSEFGGSLPCVFLDLLAEKTMSTALHLAQSKVMQAADSGSREHLLGFLRVEFEKYWAEHVMQFMGLVIKCLVGCKQRALDAGQCCGDLKPGSTQRFHFVPKPAEAPSSPKPAPDPNAPPGQTPGTGPHSIDESKHRISCKLHFGDAPEPVSAPSDPVLPAKPKSKSHSQADTKRACANCGTEALILKACGGCKTARYCNVDCQRAHWVVHKASCKN
jgi:hypothetical protein